VFSKVIHMKALSILALLLAAVGVPAQTSTKAGDAENGKKLFTKYACYQCHGYLGQGSNAGAKLAPRPLPLAGLIAYVRKPSGVMPPVTAKVVSDQELADIHAYLSSIPPAPDAKSIPLLNQ
jgi:ubiquinol-cytochrome c reductase cytochrome c subunit